MIPLTGRTTTSHWLHPHTDVWRVASPMGAELSNQAILLEPGAVPPRDAALYLSPEPNITGPGPTLHLPVQLLHLQPGDVIMVSDDGTRLRVAWKAHAVHNSILLTERCDHYCLMCSQPPKDRDDSYLYERAKRIIDTLPNVARALSLTGGEPTIDPNAFLALLHHIATRAPHLSTHVLSNGRRFNDRGFIERYASVPLADLMVGIPLYAAEPSLHDYIVQAPGAFTETVKGILNLGEIGAATEIRIVIQRSNVAELAELATFIARNLPFVNQVALMGLEMTGLARPNADLVWIDPNDYRHELRESYYILSDAGIHTRIYNHQLCLTDRDLWPAAIQSISDWKNDYPDICKPCKVKDRCSGVFTTSGTRLSPSLSPVLIN